jgi:gliding motility-associated-like protein
MCIRDRRVQTRTEGLLDWRWHFGDQHYRRENRVDWRYRRVGQFPLELAYQGPDGCRDTLRWRVRVLPSGSVDLPDAFSPNGDGLNDTFTFEILEVESVYLQVFDRWGQQVFAQRARVPTWDGRNRSGEDLPEGVYTYLAEIRLLNGDVIRQPGTVTLVR